MSLISLYDSVLHTATAAYKQKNTQDVLNMSAATLQLAQAYQMMKECELHEKFHLAEEGGKTSPGGDPLNNLGLN
jgi:heme/copper-type cytochrome/quinol oxidase subunit 3